MIMGWPAPLNRLADGAGHTFGCYDGSNRGHVPPTDGRATDPAEVRAHLAMPSTGARVSPIRRQKFLDTLCECPSVRKAALAAKIARRTLYSLRALDPEFRQSWDEAVAIGNHALVDEAIERGMDGLSDGLLKWQIQKRFPEYEDQPKTINQNLSLRLMSPEQREEEAIRILRRIQALGIPLVTIDGEVIELDDEPPPSKAEPIPASKPPSEPSRALNRLRRR
jgi:hypothetical protein